MERIVPQQSSFLTFDEKNQLSPVLDEHCRSRSRHRASPPLNGHHPRTLRTRRGTSEELCDSLSSGDPYSTPIRGEHCRLRSSRHTSPPRRRHRPRTLRSERSPSPVWKGLSNSPYSHDLYPSPVLEELHCSSSSRPGIPPLLMNHPLLPAPKERRPWPISDERSDFSSSDRPEASPSDASDSQYLDKILSPRLWEHCQPPSRSTSPHAPEKPRLPPLLEEGTSVDSHGKHYARIHIVLYRLGFLILV